MDLTWRDESWRLLPERALYRPRTRALILSDVHLGKAHDFQAAGVPVPTSVHDADFARLAKLIYVHRPAKVLVLGDLVHSHRQPYPDQAARFGGLRVAFRDVKWTLVLGNHDVRARAHLETWGFDEIVDELEDEDLWFTHDDLGERPGVSGHVHPVVKLSTGFDRLRLPCFVVGGKKLLLPSFGEFTGGYEVRPARGERIYAVAGRDVVAVPGRATRN